MPGIKGTSQELYICKNKISILTFIGKEIPIPYSDINRIDYCYASTFKPGYVAFIDNNTKKAMFEFGKKSNSDIEKAMSILHKNHKDIEIRELTPADVSEDENGNPITITDALKRTKSFNWTTKQYIKQIETHLSNQEKIIYACALNMVKNPDFDTMDNPKLIKGNISGVFIITELRLLFFYTNNLFIQHKEMLIESVKDVDARSKSVMASLRITSYAETWIFSIVENQSTEILKTIANTRKNSENNEPKNSNNSYTELREIKRLFEDGIITKEEFEAKKKQLLGI